ncbi:MAG: hypothetical protein Q7R41_10425 [Phycisphaerales bacterium]|nr:hypothetical protein [Phycisphaerales bacterium]
MKPLQMDPRIAEKVSPESSERAQKIIGTIVVTLAIGCLIAVPHLPSSPYRSAYQLCGDEGISRETVNRAMTGMRNSTATREVKLAAFLRTFQTSENEPGLLSCGRAILRESEKGK